MRSTVGLFLLAAAILSAASTPPASTDPFAGVWVGTVASPQASAEIGFAFKSTAKGLLTTFCLPEMRAWNIPLGPAALDGETINVAPLHTRLVRDGDRLVGTFGLSHLPVELRRAEALPSAPPPPPAPPAAPAPIWTTALEGEIWASPAVGEGRLYLGTTRGVFHAIEVETGRIRWRWTGPNPLYGTARVIADHVCFIDSEQRLISLRRADGALAWMARIHDEALAGAPLKANETYNHRTATPVLVDGLLVVGSSDGGIYALDVATGAVRWREAAGVRTFAAPGLDPASGDLLFAGIDGTFLSFNPRTRRETGRLRLPGPLSSTPIATGDILLLGCRDYSLYGVRRADSSVAWRFPFWFSWIESTPAIVDGVAYVGGSDFARVTALDPVSGRVQWSTVVGGLTWGTPLVTTDTVYAGTSAQRDALIAHQGGIVALDRARGTIKWRHRLPLAPSAARAGVLGSLVRAGDRVIAAAFDGTVLALPIGH
jgi:outer membrane protein assembly factor BamB